MATKLHKKNQKADKDIPANDQDGGTVADITNLPQKDTADGPMDVTELMNLLDKNRNTIEPTPPKRKRGRPKKSQGTASVKKTAAKKRSGNMPPPFEPATEPAAVATNWNQIVVPFMVTVAIVMFIGMLYFIDSNARHWVYRDITLQQVDQAEIPPTAPVKIAAEPTPTKPVLPAPPPAKKPATLLQIISQH